MISRKITVIASCAGIFLLMGLFLTGLGSSNDGSIVKVKSGLITKDTLNNGKMTFTSSALGEKKPIKIINEAGRLQWVYFGSAIPRNSPISVFEDSMAGLHLGIKANDPKEWAGFFAMSNDDYSKLYHVSISMPYRTINEGSFSAGMYIQTSVIHPFINYVACVAVVTEKGVKWTVESGTGNASEVTDRRLLWSDDNPSLPLKRDCTIVTDGSKNYKVYFDGELAYSANNLNLQMPKPFNSYLEVQTTNSKQFLYGIFTDYYSSLDENIKLVNVPAGGSVVLKSIRPNSTLTAPVGPDGSAVLHVGNLRYPVNGTIQVYDANNKLIASTKDHVTLAGGDLYSAVDMMPLQKWLMN